MSLVNSKYVKPFAFTNYFEVEGVIISDTVFQIHSKLTVYLLLIFSILVCGHSYTGRPISCIVGSKEFQDSVEHLCWVNGTFTLVDAKMVITNGLQTWEYQKEYHESYQWVVILLVLQAAIFSIPGLLWIAWEHGRIQKLCGAFNSPVMTRDNPEYDNWKEQIVTYLGMNYSQIHGAYVLRYVACEVMNFLIVVLNMFILNVAFQQFWSRFFPAVMALFTLDGPSFSTEASKIFPYNTKCTYTLTGPSGSKEIRDALCLLTNNVLNEKVFAFLYIWYVLLLFISGCNLIVRSVILLSSSIRLKIIQSQSKWSEPLTKKNLQIILHSDNIGDWFIIYLLGRNLNSFVFSDILDNLVEYNIDHDLPACDDSPTFDEHKHLWC